jgi:hypothetical protein
MNNNIITNFSSNCFGIAAIIIAVGFTAKSIQASYAGPILDHGNFPYESFTGSHSHGQSTTLLTVPAGQSFIVTGGNADGPYCDLYSDNTMVLEGYSQAFKSSGGLLNYGNAHIEIPAGASLVITGSGSTCTYYLEGYYAMN